MTAERTREMNEGTTNGTTNAKGKSGKMIEETEKKIEGMTRSTTVEIFDMRKIAGTTGMRKTITIDRTVMGRRLCQSFF